MANVVFDEILGKIRAGDSGSGGSGGAGGSSYIAGSGLNLAGGTFSLATADVQDVLNGTQTVEAVDVSALRGALTAGQAVDVTSQPDGVTGDYKNTFTVTGSLGFASFPKFATGLTYLFIAKLTATTSGTVSPSATTSTTGATATATWLDGTTTAINLTAGTQKSVAMLFAASSSATNCGASLVFSGTGSVEVTACRQYEVTACSSDAIAYIAALSNPDSFQNYYLVKRDMVSPWTYIISMPDATADKPGAVTFAAGLAYQLKAMTGTYTLMVDTCPEGYVGRETFVRIFVGQTGNVVVQHPLQLASPLVANAINNCHVSYRDGSAVLTVDDTVGGYVVDAASGTTAGTLYYGLMDSATEFISIPGAFDGIPVDLGGASVTTSGTAQKYVVGNGISNTLISGNLNAGTGKLNLSNIALSDVGITGGTMRIPDGVVVSGTVTVSSGASAILTGGAIASGATVAVSGGSLAVEKVSGNGTIELNGARVTVPSGSSANMFDCLITGGNQPSSSGGAFIISGGTLILSGTTVSGNSAYFGGGIAINTGSVSLFGAIIANNYASAGANFGIDVFCSRGSLHVSGGTVGLTVLADSNAVMTLEGSTSIVKIANYNASRGGSAVISSGAVISLTSSIAAINGVTVSGGTCTVNGHVVSSGTYTSIASDGTATPAT